MEIRSRQNREDAILSCLLGTASPYLCTNHLPALLDILAYRVTYMQPNYITLHITIMQYFTPFAITLLYTATLCCYYYICIICCYFAHHHTVALHTASLAVHTRYLHCIIFQTDLFYFTLYLHTIAVIISYQLHYFSLQYLLPVTLHASLLLYFTYYLTALQYTLSHCITLDSTPLYCIF